MEEGQRVDVIIDFKAHFGCMSGKDWNLYSKAAKEVHIYLLRGKSKSYKRNGCKIIFHTRQNLIKKLKNKTSSQNNAKVLKLIKKINFIFRSLDPDNQKTIKSL